MHAAVNPDPQSGAILTPIFQSTTYIQESIEQYLERGYSYSRTNKPTVTALEEKIAITREFATQLLPHVASGALAPVIDSRYPLADVAAAHTRMGDNANAGKLVLDVQSP